MKNNSKIINTFSVVKPNISCKTKSKSKKNIENLDNNENIIDNVNEKDQVTINNELPIKNDINKSTKPKKQLLLNGEVATEFGNFKNPKKPNRRSRSCTQSSSVLKKSKQRSNSNQNLTDIWPVFRRSERRSEKSIKDWKEQLVINKIVNNFEEGMRIIQTADKGRGVESTVTFEKDCFVVEYAGQLMSEKKARENEASYQKDSSKGSYMFYFRFKDSKYCVDATEETSRLGRLLNHSKLNPNCYVKVIQIDDVPRLAIFAKREIEIGEELLYDYGDRDKQTIEANPWLKF